jgi:hypothetical protein
MDILFRGGDRITGKRDLKRLGQNEILSFWRGAKPRLTARGDRVYFVDDGFVYAYGSYAGYRHRVGENRQGREQAGMAIDVAGPALFFRRRVRLDPGVLRGSWRWRYVPNEMFGPLRAAR